MKLEPMEIIFTISLGIAAFFLKAMYNKFNETIIIFGSKLDGATDSISKLNENVAVAVNNQTHLTRRLDKTENEVERIWKREEETTKNINKLAHRITAHDAREQLIKLKESDNE